MSKRVVIPIAAVVVIVASLIVGKVVSGSNDKSGQKTTVAADTVVKDVTDIPASVYDAVGVDVTLIKLPSELSTPDPLTATDPVTGKVLPKVLYAGAEFCPYCAAERWAVVAALSRFGTFKNLGQTASAPGDVFPDTPTLSFHGSSFSSRYVVFTGVETASNQIVNGQYAPLDTLSDADQKVAAKYDKPPYASSQGSIPFTDYAGLFVSSGAAYSPTLFSGMTHSDIATAMKDPSTKIAKSVLSAANVITAIVCKATGNQPQDVCTSKAVTDAVSAAKLN